MSVLTLYSGLPLREMAGHDAEEADLAGGEGGAAGRSEQAREVGTEAHLRNDDALVRRRREGIAKDGHRIRRRGAIG